jgi:hypothetical protein
MLKNYVPESGFFNLHCLIALSLCLSGILLVALSAAATPREFAKSSAKKSHSIASKRAELASTTATPSATTNGPSGPGWSIVSSPNEPVTGSGNLHSVACSTASDCWAVGDYSNGSKTLVEHWDGSAWRIVDSPNNTGYNTLNGVACVLANDCWAVGNYFDSQAGTDLTLIEHWNGAVWSVAPSPNENPAYSLLYDVACSASDDCWAVGYSSDGGLIEHWDGSNWTINPSPLSTSGVSVLYGVTCESVDECWAVGISTAQRPIIERWDGIAWSVSPSVPPSSFSYLVSASCLSATQCFAVGVNSGNVLIEQWDGTSWTLVSALNSGGLIDIDCGSTTCWAVGFNNGQTLIEYWDGSSWEIVPSPNAHTLPSDDLLGVVCSSSLQCWAVGRSYDNIGGPIAQTRALIEEYSPTIPPLINAASRMTHGTAGTFDVDLPLTGARGVECRNSDGNYSVVFTFANDVTNCGCAGTTGGTVIAGPNANQCTENLTGVANAQYITVELDNVLDVQNNTGKVAVPMGVLLGDVNATGLVDSGDVFLVRQQTGQNANSSNFREDVNASGLIDSGGVFLTRQQTGTSLP